MWCDYCGKRKADTYVCVGDNEYDHWCRCCVMSDAFFDRVSQEYVASGSQAVWRKSGDITDSGELGNDYEDVSPTWAEENLHYCFHCDCYVDSEHWNPNEKRCTWCSELACQRTAETEFEDVPKKYADENLAYCNECKSYVESSKWNAKEEMCTWCAKDYGRE